MIRLRGNHAHLLVHRNRIFHLRQRVPPEILVPPLRREPDDGIEQRSADAETPTGGQHVEPFPLALARLVERTEGDAADGSIIAVGGEPREQDVAGWGFVFAGEGGELGGEVLEVEVYGEGFGVGVEEGAGFFDVFCCAGWGDVEGFFTAAAAAAAAVAAHVFIVM